MKNIIIYIIASKYAKRAGLMGFEDIPINIVYDAIERAKKQYKKGNEEKYILLIAIISFVNYYKLKNYPNSPQ